MKGLFDNILRWEQNELTQPETIEMFQRLLDTGAIWQLPDSYQDNAATLLYMGLIKVAVPPSNQHLRTH